MITYVYSHRWQNTFDWIKCRKCFNFDEYILNNGKYWLMERIEWHTMTIRENFSPEWSVRFCECFFFFCYQFDEWIFHGFDWAHRRIHIFNTKSIFIQNLYAAQSLNTYVKERENLMRLIKCCFIDANGTKENRENNGNFSK